MKKIALTLMILTGVFFSQIALAQVSDLSKNERILFDCVMKSLPDCVIKALDRGANINVKDNLYGDTALHWAVRLKDYEIMRILISRGADMELPNDNGETPLYYSVKSPSYRYYALRRLIEFGANVNAPNRDGTFPIHLVAYRGHVRAVDMLINAGADVNAVSLRTERTALYWAIQNAECSDTVQLLLSAGAKVNDLGDMAHNNMIELLQRTNINL